MASTHGWILHDALGVLERSRIDYALLHGEPPERGSSGRLSDVDVVAAWNEGAEWSWLDALQSMGIFCIQKWCYDVDSFSYFLMTEDGCGGQVDVLSGSSGGNKYGLRATAALGHTRRYGRWMHVGTDDEMLYLMVKRWWKGDDLELSELRLRAQARREALLTRSLQLFAPRFHLPMAAMLTGGAPGSFPGRRQVVPVAARVLHRFLTPAGWWWHSKANEQDVRAVADVLGRTLVRSRVCSLDGLSIGSAVRLRYEVRRPGAIGTTGLVPRLACPDLLVSGSDAETLLADVVRRSAKLVLGKRSSG